MFISFEGMEGSGKSTAMARIATWVAASGREVVCTREPGGSSLGVSLRATLLDARNSDIAPLAELFLYLADRAQHVACLVRPALARGAVVLTDRFADSTLVYQGWGRGLSLPVLETVNALAVDGLWPDLTLVFDLDPETGIARARVRNAAEGKNVSEGRFEAEALAFHARVRQGFLELAARYPERIVVIDAARDMETVFLAARAAVAARLAPGSV